MSAISPGRLAIMLGTLVALGPLAIDTYLPALLTMAGHFDVPIHDVEISVSVYVLGVALGQWLGGPFSDQYGRKPVACTGLVLFIAASLMIPWSVTVEQLYLLRFVEALGGGATVVIAAASVRDHFTGRQAAQVLTTIGLVMLLAPLLARHRLPAAQHPGLEKHLHHVGGVWRSGIHDGGLSVAHSPSSGCFRRQ